MSSAVFFPIISFCGHSTTIRSWEFEIRLRIVDTSGRSLRLAGERGLPKILAHITSKKEAIAYPWKMGMSISVRFLIRGIFIPKSWVLEGPPVYPGRGTANDFNERQQWHCRHENNGDPPTDHSDSEPNRYVHLHHVAQGGVRAG
jgi:hypothetical protein